MKGIMADAIFRIVLHDFYKIVAEKPENGILAHGGKVHVPKFGVRIF